VIFGRSTIERWYYKALRAKAGPVAALRRKIRSDHGQHPSVKPKLIELLTQQHRAHPRWSYQLHFDNLAVLVEQEPQAGPLPAYVSLLRWMKSHGLFKRARRGPVHSPGAQAAERRFEAREIRSYESEYVNGLWHLDFHHGPCACCWPMANGLIRFCWVSSMTIRGFVATCNGIWPKALASCVMACRRRFKSAICPDPFSTTTVRR
jgi:hypothetical protein